MKKKSFINIFFTYTILVFLAGTGVLSYFLTYNQYVGFDKEINKTKQDFISDNKIYIKNNVENVIDYISYKRNQKEEISRKKVREHIYNIDTIIKSMQKEFIGKSLKEKRDYIIPFLRSYSFNEGKGYLFGIDREGILLFNRNNAEIEGKQVIDIKDTEGNIIIKKILESLETTNESLVTYYWKNPDLNEIDKKFTYSKYISELDIIICCGDYYEDIVRELKHETVTRIRNTRLPDGEYFFIFDSDNKIILHKRQHLEGFSLLNIFGIDGNLFFQKLKNSPDIEKGIFAEEKFSLSPLTNKITPRMIYIKKIPEWDWYIATGIFYDKLNNEIISKTNTLKRQFRDFLFKICIILLTFIILGNLIIYLFFKRFKIYYNDFLTNIKRSILQSVPVNTDNIEYSEFLDISESTNDILEEVRKSHSELIKSQKRYRIAQKIINIANWEYDIETDEYVFSPEFYDLLDIKPSYNEQIFETFINKVYEKDREKINFIISHSKRTKKDWKLHYRITVNNQIRWIEEIAEFYNDPQSEKKSKTRIIGVVRDITKEKTVNLSLVDAKEKAERSDRLKSDFLANMSHEVKTPLTTIVGFSDVLIKKSSDDNIKFLSNIKKAANYLKNIMDNILDISKIESGDLNIITEKFNIFDLFENIKEQYQDYSGKKENVQFIYSNTIKKDTFLNSDSARIRQIICNLLDNSFKFTEHGSVELKVEYNNNQLNIIVKDSGIGVSEEEKNFIFEKFRQADSSITRKYCGLGLGLSIVNSLVKLLNGSIEFESVKGSGSEFRIFLPDADKKKTINKNINVLVVEDNRQNNELIREFLSSEKNIIVYNSYNGIEAIEQLRDNTIDVIISDIQMPDMNGVELLEFIKNDEKLHNISIIALTAHAMMQDREKFLEKGFDEYIAKPFSPSKLINTIYSVFNKKDRI